MFRFMFFVFFALLLVGCTGRTEPQQPVITTDDIEPNTTADEVVEAAQSEMNYPYFWLAENGEENIELAINGELVGYNINNDSDVDILKATVAQQQTITHIITAQEAANIAGEILEYSFGVDEELLAKMDLYLDGENWRIDTGSTPPYQYQVIVDNTTGALISAAFTPTYDMDYINRMNASPVDAAYIIVEGSTAEGSIQDGYWNREGEEFNDTVNRLQAELEKQLTDSPILQGATIVEITENGTDLINFEVELSNKRTLEAGRLLNIDRFTSFNYDGYGLRAYYFKYSEETS